MTPLRTCRPPVRENASWLLAKARLQRGEIEPAQVALEPLTAGSAEQATDARPDGPNLSETWGSKRPGNHNSKGAARGPPLPITS